MKSSKWIIQIALLAGFGLCQLNCVANQTTFLIEGNALMAEGNCAPAASSSDQRTLGYLDLAMARQYLFYPIVKNALPNALGPVGNPLVDLPANDIIISGYKVEYKAPNLAVAYQRKLLFPSLATVTAGSSLGLEIILVPRQVIDELRADPLFNNANLTAAQTRQIQTEMLVKFQFFGRTRAGFTVTTEWYTFPIIVCRGCLASALKLSDGESCADTSTAPENELKPCEIGQDRPIDCRICRKLALTQADQAYCDADIIPGS